MVSENNSISDTDPDVTNRNVAVSNSDTNISNSGNALSNSDKNNSKKRTKDPKRVAMGKRLAENMKVRRLETEKKVEWSVLNKSYYMVGSAAVLLVLFYFITKKDKDNLPKNACLNTSLNASLNASLNDKQTRSKPVVDDFI